MAIKNNKSPKTPSRMLNKQNGKVTKPTPNKKSPGKPQMTPKHEMTSNLAKIELQKKNQLSAIKIATTQMTPKKSLGATPKKTTTPVLQQKSQTPKQAPQPLKSPKSGQLQSKPGQMLQVKQQQKGKPQQGKPQLQQSQKAKGKKQLPPPPKKPAEEEEDDEELSDEEGLDELDDDMDDIDMDELEDEDEDDDEEEEEDDDDDDEDDDDEDDEEAEDEQVTIKPPKQAAKSQKEALKKAEEDDESDEEELDEEEDDEDDDEEEEDSDMDEEGDDEEEEEEEEEKPAMPVKKADAKSVKQEKQDEKQSLKRKWQENLEGKVVKKQKVEEGSPPTDVALKEVHKKTLFMRCIPSSTKEEEVKALSKDIVSVRFPNKSKMRHSKIKFAFVEFANEAMAEKNHKILEGKKLGGSAVSVDYCGEKSAFYKNKNQEKKVNPKRLYISQLDPETTKQDLKVKFPFATSVDFRKIGDQLSAHLTFISPESAAQALKSSVGLKIKERPVLTMYAKTANRKNRKQRKAEAKKQKPQEGSDSE